VLRAGDPEPEGRSDHVHVPPFCAVSVCVPPGEIVVEGVEIETPTVTWIAALLPHPSVSVTTSVPAVAPAL